MPEGDTIHRTAEVLRRAIRGFEVVRAVARHGPRYGGPPDMSRVVGSTVGEVDARGKHLLIAFSSGLALHTHLGLHGTWHTYPAAATPARVRTAAVQIETAQSLAACFGPVVLELVDARSIDRVPALAALGPDLLADDFDPAEARRRIRARPDVPVTEALLDQRALAGLGNVYKSEICFLSGLYPWTDVGEVEDVPSVVALAKRLMEANRATGMQVTTGVDRPGRRQWVYGRRQQPCWRCGSPIQKRAEPAQRVTYWCPGCQPAVEASTVVAGGH